MKEWTVDERADLVEEAFPEIALTKKQTRDLDEVLYTMSEAGRTFEGIKADEAVFLAQLVELARQGKVTGQMRL